MIRPATARDAAEIAAIEAALFGADAWREAQVADELTGPGRRGWVVTGRVDEVTGYVITMTLGEVADLQRIGVHPEHQRQGLAGRLLEQATTQGEADGADRMLLEVSATNEAAIRFYGVCGFVDIDRRPRYYRDGSDALVLQRSLATNGREE